MAWILLGAFSQVCSENLEQKVDKKYQFSLELFVMFQPKKFAEEINIIKKYFLRKKKEKYSLWKPQKSAGSHPLQAQYLKCVKLLFKREVSGSPTQPKELVPKDSFYCAQLSGHSR